MSIWADQTLKDLVERVKRLEEEVARLRAENIELKGAILGPEPKKQVNARR